MPVTLKQKVSRPRKSLRARRRRTLIIEKIPIRKVGSLPVTELELELEQLAGPDLSPQVLR